MKCTQTLLKNINGKDIMAYNVCADNGFEVEILNLGGIITKIMTPDKDGKLENVVVGYKDIQSYIENPSYFGAIIGRTSGRICEGKVVIENKEYELNKNYGLHQGHGGNEGFSDKIWDVEVIEELDNITLKLSCKSLDGEENYTGNLNVVVSFKIYENYTIEQTYEAISDKTTLVNMTNHSYFNLSGNIKTPVTDQFLKLDSNYILELDDTCVPTGKTISVDNSPFDFRELKCIGEDIDYDDEQIKIGCGYDHAFLLGDEKSIYLEHKEYKRAMSISTDQKSCVIYSMNFPDDIQLYNGKKNQRRFGICFETQAPPIGRKMCFMENSILNKNDKYNQKTVYKFLVNDAILK